MTRQFRSFLKRKQKRHHHWNRDKFNRNAKVLNEVICYECRKPGHIKTDCPKLKGTPSKEKVEKKPIVKKGKKKFQRAFWADSASDSSETEKEEEVTNLCLMADSLDQSNQEEGCSHTRLRESIWYLDSGCSKHMTGDTTQFISLEARSGGKVTLGDNTTRKVVGLEHKRKKNIALGYLVAYILEKKYNLVHPNQEFEEPLYYNDGSFRAIFKEEPSKTHVISDTKEEPEAAPAPANEPNYQDLVQRFDHLETHFDQRFDQIETHLQQQAAQYQYDMNFMRDQMNDINTNVLMMSTYFNIFGAAPPPPPPDQGPSQ
ncbi:hypothetical protein KFK09_024134 [Dendrobium nobile]|uniref:CCHC-type domain-containing protein n=1 Tax=Dendrobium nobile TaxID=94219 RepID=A0A8T3AD80_DENNO|nr:hypothetical protein KFK09_024134 [Dendrobium nobile]